MSSAKGSLRLAVEKWFPLANESVFTQVRIKRLRSGEIRCVCVETA